MLLYNGGAGKVKPKKLSSEAERNRLFSFELIQPIKPSLNSACFSARSAGLTGCAIQTLSTWSTELFKHPVNYSETSAVCWTNSKTDCTWTFYIWSHCPICISPSPSPSFSPFYTLTCLFHTSRSEAKHSLTGPIEMNAFWAGRSCTDESCP